MDSKDSDQTGWMPRLILVFAGHTCHFDSFVMRRFKCLSSARQLQETCMAISRVPFHRHKGLGYNMTLKKLTGNVFGLLRIVDAKEKVKIF